MPRAVEPRPHVPAVLVAVLTYRRPDDLAALLASLRTHVEAVGADVLVVDNDPQASAAGSVASTGWARYVHEPTPGIAAARNRALEESAGHDLLVFIDDDERPQGGWLRALMDAYARQPCSGVVGPVVSTFAVPLDPWVAAGEFFRRRRMPTGTVVDVAATNNLLLDVAAVRAAGIRFDDRLGLSGGSDTLFTRRLSAEAGPLVWCDEAVVTDVVPDHRSSRSWVLRRQLRSGNSWSRTALMLAPSAGDRLRLRLGLTVMGAARVAVGAARWMIGVPTASRVHRARGAKTLARGLGMILGAYGYDYIEYRRASAPARVMAA
jgi:succinoglycan biosynthesis protein ExoM